MRIERIEVFPVRLPMKAVLTLPRGPSRTLEEGKRIALVKITDADGNVGWGEAGPSRRWSAETLESCVSTLREYLAPALIGHDVFDIAGAHAKMNVELASGLDPGQPIAKCALDVALHDLVCRRLGIPLQAWLGAKRADRVRLARLVSAATPEEAATQAYTLEEAVRMAKAFERLGVTLFEQPVPMADVYAMKKLLSATALTIALDEAAIGIPYVIELIRREAVEGLAIKVSKVGGIHYARQMCDLALNAGLKLIGSGLQDAPIGFAASVHLFAAYGITDPVDLNGPQFIAEDYLKTPFPIDGQIAHVPKGPGLGIDIDEAKVKAFALPQ